MAPSKAPNSWDDEDSDSSPSTSPMIVAQRRKFDDEDDDSDVVDSWDAAEDSAEEREKAKKAAEAKAKAEAEKKANHKSRSERIAAKREQNRLRRMQDGDATDEDNLENEDEAERRSRLRASEKASDLQNAQDLFDDIGVPATRGAVRPVTVQASDDPNQTIDLTSLKLFLPNTASQFAQLRETVVPLFNQNSKKGGYPAFLVNFTKDVARDLNSDQVKKLASALSALSNEKMKEEKAAERGGKKSKLAKTKTTLAANRHVVQTADLTNYDYDDGLDDDDFM